MFDTLEKKLITGIAVALWLAILAWLVLRQTGGAVPSAPAVKSIPGAANTLHTVRGVEDLFSLAFCRQLKPFNNLQNPFYPNPKQPMPPPVAPPKTKTIDMVYQGYFATSRGEKTAYIQAGDQFVLGTNGAKVLAVFKISEIGSNSLTLLDANGKPVILEFRSKKSIEIPIP
jgi:hypothetical protein